MARSRNLKPGFFKNETLAECSPLARLLFAGLWCLADRAGRLEDRPKRIRVELLPYDDGSVDDMLNELHMAGFILRYQVGESRFIQVLNFDKHQTPHHKEPASSIPAPDLPKSSPGQAPDLPKSSRADSLNLIPDSLNPSTTTAPTDSANRPAPKQPAKSAKPKPEPIIFDGQGFAGIDPYVPNWRKAYPAISIETETAKAAAWLVANPKNRKSNLARFLTNWFSRAQDKAPAQGGGTTAGKDWT